MTAIAPLTSDPGPMYPRPVDLAPPPRCVICGSTIAISTQGVPGTGRVVIATMSCTQEVEHNPANADIYGGRLEKVITARQGWAATRRPHCGCPIDGYSPRCHRGDHRQNALEGVTP